MEERVLSFFPPPGKAKLLVNIWRQGEPVKRRKGRYFLGSGLGMYEYASSHCFATVVKYPLDLTGAQQYSKTI